MNRVDVHAHCLPPSYYEFLKFLGEKDPDGFPTPTWSVESQIQSMEDLHISFSFLSISSPPVTCNDEEITAKYVRKINEEMSSYVMQYPNKLGFFAILPLPYINKALEEIDYCINTLKCDGFGLPTNYLGKHLGNLEFTPIYQKFQENKSILCIHPCAPLEVPKDIDSNFFPTPAMEFFFETTRTVACIIINNIVSQYPDIKWIIPHAGACIPIFSDRWQDFNGMMRMKGHENCDFKRDLAKLYYDLAGMAVPKLLHDLMIDVPVSHLLYGSDGPYTNLKRMIELEKELDQTNLLNDEVREEIYIKNAIQLVPRLCKILGNK